MARAVVVTGVGLVTPLGDTMAQFSQRMFGSDPVFTLVRTAYTPPVPGARVAPVLPDGISRGEAMLLDRHAQMAVIAATRALHDAGLEAGTSALTEGGVFVGNGSGPTASMDAGYAALQAHQRMHGLTLMRCLPSGAAAAIAIRHGLRGPAAVTNAACASSTMAIGDALRAIRHGYLDVAIAGGSETPFGDATVRAWDAMRVLAPPGDDPGAACRPFDRHRRGLVLGEGAAFFVLESAAHAAARGARCHARLVGYAAGCDAHHWTEPSREGQVRVMQAALDDARMAPGDVGCINAHGTGTPVGDAIEAASIASVFGHGPASPWVVSTKSAHGHWLGASGAIELAAVIATLAARRVPPTRHLREPDERCALRLVQGHPVGLPAGRAVLSNSFAFGDSNACLVVSPAGIG